MFDWLVETFSSHAYFGCAILFLLCGLGLPLPEEVVLLFAGYVCFEGLADREAMMAVCCGAILAGDVIPFVLGRHYGPRLLRIRLLRILITPQRLARFDRWFRRRGELVVFFSRFVAGIRVVCYFTAGTMRMAWLKFLALDLAGILLIGPLLVWVGHRYGETIRAAVASVTRVERGILIGTLVSGAIVGGWYWLRRRRRQRMLVGEAAETFVEPSTPVQAPPPDLDRPPTD
ncbi:MAG: DedA family protein [Planctomycetes bacterium]|nr:DedA family protein [Planctomycetota bacterium]